MSELTPIAEARLRVRVAPDTSMMPDASCGGLICLMPGACVETPRGQRRVEDLMPGEVVLACDGAPQEILWTGRRRMTGARLFAMPHLRPVRLRAGALGPGRPNADLCVAPGHRVMPRAGAEPVAVTDLVDGRSVRIEPGSLDVVLIQILFARATVIRVNGVECAGLTPANAPLDRLDPTLRAALARIPQGPPGDGDTQDRIVQRALTGPEAAILRQVLG